MSKIKSSTLYKNIVKLYIISVVFIVFFTYGNIVTGNVDATVEGYILFIMVTDMVLSAAARVLFIRAKVVYYICAGVIGIVTGTVTGSILINSNMLDSSNLLFVIVALTIINYVGANNYFMGAYTFGTNIRKEI